MKQARLNGQDTGVADNVATVPAIDINTGKSVQVVVQPGQSAAEAAAINSVQFTAGGPTINLYSSQIPSAATLDHNLVPVSNAVDIMYHEFYDSAALTSAAANTPTLFQQPAIANVYNSNMPGNGRLDNNQRFWMVGIRWELENNDTSNPLDYVDVKETYRLGTYQFWVGEKYYNASKFMRFIIPNTFIVLNTKYYTGNCFITWKLPLPIAIGMNNSFKAPIQLTAATLDATTRLFGYICGFWYRQVQ